MVGPRWRSASRTASSLLISVSVQSSSYVSDPNIIGDAESKVQVGEAVGGVYGEQANSGSGDHALILVREPQNAIAKSIPLLNGEHRCDPSSAPRLPTVYVPALPTPHDPRIEGERKGYSRGRSPSCI